MTKTNCEHRYQWLQCADWQAESVAGHWPCRRRSWSCAGCCGITAGCRANKCNSASAAHLFSTIFYTLDTDFKRPEGFFVCFKEGAGMNRSISGEVGGENRRVDVYKNSHGKMWFVLLLWKQMEFETEIWRWKKKTEKKKTRLANGKKRGHGSNQNFWKKKI